MISGNSRVQNGHPLLLGPDGKPLTLHTTQDIRDSYFVRLPDNTMMPWPERHMRPHGYLETSLAAAALWYFFQVAHNSAEVIKSQVSLEGDQDAEVTLMTLARQIAAGYHTSLEDMFETYAVRRAYAEVERNRMTVSQNVRTFIETGGTNFNGLERDVT